MSCFWLLLIQSPSLQQAVGAGYSSEYGEGVLVAGDGLMSHFSWLAGFGTKTYQASRKPCRVPWGHFTLHPEAIKTVTSSLGTWRKLHKALLAHVSQRWYSCWGFILMGDSDIDKRGVCWEDLMECGGQFRAGFLRSTTAVCPVVHPDTSGWWYLEYLPLGF